MKLYIFKKSSYTQVMYLVFAFAILYSCKNDDTVGAPESEAPSIEEEAKIKDIATQKGIGFGMAYDISSDTVNNTIFENEINTGQVGWYPAWGGWISQNEYNFSELNTEINYVHNQEFPVIMHMLFGPNGYLPDWFTNGTWTNAEMETMMQNLIQNIMEANDNHTKVDIWNVVNEATSWDGDEWEDSKWLQLGYEIEASGLTGTDKVFDSIPIYIRKVFEYARLYTDKELELRDYLNDGIESRWDNSELKTKGFYQLVKHLVNTGVPIDAVGFQGHLNIDVPATFSKFTETVQKFKALGLKVYITELDAEQNDASTAWNSTISMAQADYYYNYVKAGLEGGVDGVYTWGIRDDQDPWWRFGENALLFDTDGNPKDAYFAVRQAFIDFEE